MAASDLTARARQLAARLTPVQKIGLGAATLTLVAGGLLLTRSGGATDLAPLYTDLASTDAAAVVDDLSSRGVPYELTDAGRTVLVPSDDVYDLRVALSGEGLPSSNDGYALLDQQGITTSEFRQRIDFQRAMEGELARTIRAIDGITSATVHLALPEESVFVDETTPPTASVLVAGEEALNDDQIDAIVHLVSSSVKNLQPDGITLVGADGQVLSAPGRVAGGAGGRTAKARAEAAYEHELATALTSMLTRVTGPGRATVTVSADLDLSERQSTSENYTQPATDAAGTPTGAVVSENTSTETYTGAADGATGVLGPDGAPATGAPAGANDYQREDSQRSYALDRTVEQVTETPGTLQRLSVAVLLDENTVDAGQLAPIEEMVTAAAGIDPARQDTVEVTRLPFDNRAAEAAEAAGAADAAAVASKEQATTIRTLAIAGVAVVALFLGFLSARRARKVVATPIDVGQISAGAAHPELTPLGPADTREYALGDGSGRTEPDAVGLRTRDAAIGRISELADDRPDDVANVLRGWLAESRSAEAGHR